MSRFFVLLSFILTLLGCASTSRLDTRYSKKYSPPSESFLEKWKNSSSTDLEKINYGQKENEIFWWKTYKVALANQISNRALACSNFKVLSHDREFPLKDLALIRAHDTCEIQDQLEPLPATTAPWYQDLFVEVRLKETLRSPDPTDELEPMIVAAQLQNNKKIKEELLQNALNLARRIGIQNKAEELEAALYKNSPRLNPSPSMEDWAAIALDYRYHRDFEAALKTYESILNDPKTNLDDQFQALKNIRQTLKVAQRKEDYINATVNLVNWARKHFTKNKKDRKALIRFHDSQMIFAKTLWTEDRTSQAVQALNETNRLLKGSYPMDEVYFILGRIEEEKGNFTKAIEFLEASYKEEVTVPGLRDKISWVKSWNYYKLSQWENAKFSFEQMKEVVKDPTDKARASFWLARVLKQLQKIEEAKSELQQLIQNDPLGYYGVLAVRELAQEFLPVKKDTEDISQLSLLSISELEFKTRITAEWLISVGEKSSAEKILNFASDELKKKSITDTNSWLALSSAYAKIGLYLPFFAMINSMPPEMKDHLLKLHPDLLFPQPFKNIISAASQKSGTPVEFIYSIIRQESAFNPEARSAADAFGLMQLLPSIAQKLAKNNSLPYSEPADLFKPEVNIPLGAFELKSLMGKYNNQFILAVSGYNANDQAIRGWLKTRFREDPIEFIEEVPYEETRTYIKLVLRNYVFYQRLLSGGKRTPFPERLLALKSKP